MLGRPSSASSLASSYAAYEASKAFDSVDSSLVPSFASMNPLTTAPRAAGQRWQPVPGLYHSKESLYFRAAVGRLLQRAHAEISPTDLEVRANTPEFRVEDGDWVAHKNQRKFALDTPQFLDCVSRIPANLILLQHQVSHAVPAKLVSGVLRKRGEGIKAFKKRYMELDGSVLAYYRKKPEKHGIPLSKDEKKSYEKGVIDLDRVSSVQPMDNKSEPFGFLLVTTARTWVLAAESESEYHRWVKALCGVVKFSAVHVIYKRQFQLREVNAQAITDVRMAVTTSDTVGEIVEHIFNCYKQALDAAPLKPYDPTEYLLKITGFRDYMVDRYRILNEYVHVRECLMTKKTIRLTVVHKSIIRETAMLNLSIRSNLQLAGDSRASRATNQVDEALEADRSASLQMTTLGDTDWEQPQPDRKAPIPSVMVQEPFAIRIHRVLNIPRTTCVLKRTSEAANITSVELASASVLVRIALYDGGQLIENSVVDTTDVRLKAQRNDLLYVEWTNPVWHKFSIDFSEMTRTMRVELTVIGIKKVIGGSRSNGQEEKMLVTGINAFEVDGTLTQGPLYVRMLNNLYSCVQGPVPHVALPIEPLMHVEFCKFDAPVIFDWSDTDLLASSVRPHRTSIVQSNRSSMLHKEGWLRKVGNYKSLTRWRRRWFIVDQGTCSLSYADDQTAAHKQISLKNCTVSTADDMNQTFTTAPVNSGTRRVRQTWCFKVRPVNSSREYIMSADTKQSREAWMNAIQTVANNGSVFSDTITFEESNNGEVLFEESPRPSISDQLSRFSISTPSKQRRNSGSCSSDSSGQRDSCLKDLRKLILLDPLYRFSSYQKSQLWMYREELLDLFQALPRVLSCVHWDDPMETEEALSLLPRWAEPDHQAAYIELLNGEFANEGVRTFAVQKLGQMADTTFSYFLPQLVQAIKYENHHASPLVMLLIERAIKNPNQIGFDLFWSMKVESHSDQYRERYGTILNTYLDVCSSKMRAILKLQDKLFSEGGMLERICQSVKAKKNDGAAEMKRAMQQGLEALNELLPGSFQLPLDPRIEVGKIIVSKCRVMDSAKKPLWLVFENAEEGGAPVTVMFKAGDDVRQDCLTLQLIRLMDEMWREEGLDLAMEPYKCVATSPMTGILQIVPNSVTTADVHKRGGILGSFKDPIFAEWIHANNPDAKSHKAAVNLFTRSCAGYCIATYVLGIGDRHNDNIMISSAGRYFHIDFGHFLGHLKYSMGMARERSPFVFTKEMAYVMGGTQGKDFGTFLDIASIAYNVLRRHMHLLVSLLLLMVPADMPELTGRDDINYIVSTLKPEFSEEQACESLLQTVSNCLGSWSRRFDNTIHNLVH
ncbi:Phosphatidylinositol 3-kinase 2 [Phytophthora fragariae]|uniref:phosphatidylinositol 3-kinase n=1 Tax=Phytophthora fragariae TaxID=53985 RepID=A0A6G0S393_9STRA|nr:Phosphatidylinositol 3-kinase 2 [Phytophthora fragariae]